MARTDTPIAESSFLAPTKPDELIEWAKRKLDKGRARVPEQQMRLNMAFVLGHQWVVWDKTRGQFIRPSTRANDPNPPVRITANKIGGIVERQIAKLTKSAPLPETRPSSNSDDDVDAARVSTRILDHEMNRLQWDSMLTTFYFWPTTLGFSYMHLYWNPDDGEPIGEDDDGELMKGEINVDIVPAFELSVDPNARTMEDALWCVRTTTWSKEAVWEKWGKIPVAPEAGRSLADEVFSLNSGDSSISLAQRRGAHGDDFIQVHQLWMRPSRAVPKGIVMTWSGSTILEGPLDFPYNHRKLPFIQFDLLPGLGTREGRTWVTDLIPLQTDYNDARSREATIRRLLTPKILTPTGSIDPNRVTARVEVITYNPTGPEPKMMIPDSGWMSQYEAGMQRADAEMGERAGQQDVSSGRTPSSSMPAAAILALQEADDTKLAISAKQLAASIERFGWQLLMLTRQFWTEERVVRTWSDDNTLETYRYKGADVGAQLDVYLSSESAMPKSKSARASLALDLNQRQVPPFNDPRTLVRFLEMPGSDFIMDALSVDAKQAQRENGDMVNGTHVEVHDFDNHAVHITEHNNFRKSRDYERLDVKLRGLFDAHVAVHHEVVVGQAAAAAQQALGPQTAPTGPHGPGSTGAGDYINPLTGQPSDPVQVATGEQPSSLAFGDANIRQQAGIGGPGQPGAVPGIAADQQAASTGN
jgi:hypothetical protein